MQFRAAVGYENAGMFSTCFPVTWFLAALQSLSFTDCCPQLSLALCLIDETARKKPSSLFLSAVTWLRSGLKGKFAQCWQEQYAKSSLLAVSHPPKLPERKRSFVFSACSWLLLLLLLWVRKNKASFDSVFIFRCIFFSCLIQYLTSIKHWDTIDFPTTFTGRPDSQKCLEGTCGCHLPHLLLEAELVLELNQISHVFV